MSNKVEQSSSGWGLLANGSCDGWDIAVDESLEGGEWSLEIDGPQTYLVFDLQDLQVIRTALGFLESKGQQDQNLPLGRFGSASVSLIWDNEDFPRCFIVIGPKARSTLRLSLDGENLQKFTDALGQVAKDLPETA